MHPRNRMPVGGPLCGTIEETFKLVHRIKQSVGGLMIALILADFIGRIIDDQPLTSIGFIAQVAAALICLAYYIVQHRFDH